ncbi:MAG TPA: hypothetical protein VN917_08800, partial [Xanthobacteraceae bacterium]|nr:hypothetical protein [Xanthobacteraceae bacterium]
SIAAGSSLGIACGAPILPLSPDPPGVSRVARAHCGRPYPRTGVALRRAVDHPRNRILWICCDQLKSAKHLRAEIRASVSP